VWCCAWCPGAPSTLFDNPHITDRDGYIEALKASFNFDTAKVKSEM